MTVVLCPVCKRPGIVVHEVTTGNFYVECFSEYCNLEYKKVRYQMNEQIVLENNGIYAKDADIGVPYLTSTGKKLVVRSKNISGDVMNSVTVEEDGWVGPIPISALSVIYPYDASKRNSLNTTTTRQRSTSMSNTDETKPVPRSKIIDAELAKLAGTELAPDIEAIATAVISAGSALEEDRAKVKNQIKARHHWYVTGKKTNPAQAQNVTEQQAPPPPTSPV